MDNVQSHQDTRTRKVQTPTSYKWSKASSSLFVCGEIQSITHTAVESSPRTKYEGGLAKLHEGAVKWLEEQCELIILSLFIFYLFIFTYLIPI